VTRNGGRGNRRRTWQLLAACGGVLLAGIVFFVGTGEGRVEITVNHPDVKVSVDGEPHQIKVLDGTTDEYRIELPNIPAGRREIVVTRDGFAAVTRHFWITRNGERAFEMRLVPVASESDTNTAVIASRNDKPDPETPRAAVVNNLGPAENILPGLIPRPTTIPGIKRWNIESRAIRSNVSELAYSPDGELLACGTYSGRVRVYEARTGELVNVLTGEPSPIWALAWSPDSQTLAVGSQNGVLLRWTRDGARIPRRFHSRATADIAWSRDGLVLAVAGVDRVDFVDANQASVQTIDMPGSEIRSAAFSSDGQRFVIGFANGDVSFWNRTSGLEVSHDAHRNGVQTVAWDPTGDVIATGSDDGKVKLWNSDGTPRAVLDGHQSAVTDLDWHPTGDSLVSVDASEVIYRWSKTGELLERRQSPAGKVPYAIVWAPDGDYYSVAGGGRRIVHLPEATTTPESIQGHDLRLTDLEWDSAGARFATAGSDSFVRVFDRDAKPSLFIKTPSKVKGLAWSPDDKQLATSQGKAIVQIWNLTTRRETNSLRPLGGNHTLYSVAWNSITGELAVASANQSATVWRLPNESSPLQRMHNGRVECAE
jgi:WD40 repeat protein